MQETPSLILGSTHYTILGLPWWLSWERICLQCGRPGFDPWVGKIPWRMEWLPTPVFWPGEFHGLYSPWGHKESDMTEWLSFSLVAQMVKNLPAMLEISVRSLGQEDSWRREWQPTPVFLPGKSHGQRSLAGYSLWGYKELDTTNHLTLHWKVINTCYLWLSRFAVYLKLSHHC